MKKFIFSFILILLFLLSVSAHAEGDIFSYSFLSSDDEKFWSGCFFDRSVSFDDGYCAFINNPFGEVKDGLVTHVIDYSGKIYLESGKTYKLSGYVMNPLSENNHKTHTEARLENSANTIIVTVSGANTEWQYFSTTFYAGKTGEFNLSLHFMQGNEDFGFFIDELSLKEEKHTLSKIGVRGTDEIMIPINTVSKTKFTPYLISSEGEEISILSDDSVTSSCRAAVGIEYSARDFILTVTPSAVSDSTLTIDFALENYSDLSPTSYTVSITDNMIDDSSFDLENPHWTSSAKISVIKDENGGYISIPTNDYGDYGYYTTLTYNDSQLLIGGELYVLRAKVRSDSNVTERDIYAKNTAVLEGSDLFFEIKDVPGDKWKEVFAAFVPETSGIYDISINLYSLYDANILVDDVTLSAESLRPEYITLHAPGNIAVPDIMTAYPVTAYLRDQLGNIIDGDISISLQNGNGSLQFDSAGGFLSIFPDTLQGEYFLKAVSVSNPSIKAELSFTVSFDYIGDGAFEKTAPNEWWTVASPFDCSFYLRNDGYSRRSLVNSDGPYFILLNNSYVHLIKDTPYVFSSEFSSAKDCTVTLFIEDLDSIVHPLAQFRVAAGTTLGEKLSPELFLAEESVVGRIFLYIQADNADSFSIYADNLSLKKASILSANLHAVGNFRVNGTAEARFSLYNSVTQDGDISSSVVNWYISSAENGPYSMLEKFDTNIYFDTTFYNKYVYFEVIPVCPVTGFSGETARSAVYHITAEEIDDSSAKDFLRFPKLSPYGGETVFEDIKGHWAETFINELKYNEIIAGRTNTRFSPKEYMTRAEFAKLIANAFSAESVTDISQFSDISKSDWFYKEVCALSQLGIINGISHDKFAPKKNITRQEAIVIIMRIYENFFNITARKELPFNDVNDISSYAEEYVQAAYELGIVEGNHEGNLMPKNKITRAEAVALVYRLIK